MDPINYLFEKPMLSGRLARWQLLLSECDITYITHKTVKGKVIAEYLVENPIDDYQLMFAPE